jgi:hypothetical protein
VVYVGVGKRSKQAYMHSLVGLCPVGQVIGLHHQALIAKCKTLDGRDGRGLLELGQRNCLTVFSSNCSLDRWGEDLAGGGDGSIASLMDQVVNSLGGGGSCQIPESCIGIEPVNNVMFRLAKANGRGGRG